MRKSYTPVCLLLFITSVSAEMEDDPLLTSIMVNEFEYRTFDSSNALTWDVDAWAGKDLNKLWIKSENERVDGETEETELQVLYHRAFASYWDLQTGWRIDLNPRPNRQWLVLGIQGLAPYIFHVDVAAFVGESGRVAARLELEYELLITQRLILTPELEVNFHSKDEPVLATGSGLSDIETGFRLRYEIHRKFAPYIGLNWVRKFGDTARFAKATGGNKDDIQFIAGIRAWF